jgi:hypothetical protein
MELRRPPREVQPRSVRTLSYGCSATLTSKGSYGLISGQWCALTSGPPFVNKRSIITLIYGPVHQETGSVKDVLWWARGQCKSRRQRASREEILCAANIEASKSLRCGHGCQKSLKVTSRLRRSEAAPFVIAKRDPRDQKDQEKDWNKEFSHRNNARLAAQRLSSAAGRRRRPASPRAL